MVLRWGAPRNDDERRPHASTDGWQGHYDAGAETSGDARREAGDAALAGVQTHDGRGHGARRRMGAQSICFLLRALTSGGRRRWNRWGHPMAIKG